MLAFGADSSRSLTATPGDKCALKPTSKDFTGDIYQGWVFHQAGVGAANTKFRLASGAQQRMWLMADVSIVGDSINATVWDISDLGNGQGYKITPDKAGSLADEMSKQVQFKLISVTY